MNVNHRSPLLIVVYALVSATCTYAGLSAADSASPSAAAPSTAASPNPGTALPDDIQKALQLPEGKARADALRTAGMAWEKKDPRAALAWAFTLSKTEGFDVVRVMANDWGDREPVPAKDWVMGQSQPIKNGSLSILALHLIVTAWARHDPPAASAWADAQPANSDIRSTAYYSVADGWAQKEPGGGADWSAKLPGDGDRKIAVAKVGDIWSRKWNKPDAAAAWAEKLPVPDMKSAAPGIATAWAKTDADKARAWVNGLPLSDADKAEILGKIK